VITNWKDEATVSNGFSCRGLEETVRNGSRNYLVELDHRAEAAVLMKSLRVPHRPSFKKKLIWQSKLTHQPSGLAVHRLVMSQAVMLCITDEKV
jgi:hypothetical protein